MIRTFAALRNRTAFAAYATVLAIGLAAVLLGGCFSAAAQSAPGDATLDCLVLTGQGAGYHLLTDKGNAVANGWDTSADVYCDVAS